jgi:signal peptidase II
MLGAMLGVVADQMTKAAAFAHVAERGDCEVAPFLAITAGMNPGIAFGLATTVHPAMLIAVAGAISIVLVLMIRRSAGWLRTAALGAILGGAAGNVADPLRFGAVRDLIDLHWQEWHWPTFNLADASIAVGVLMLLISADPADGSRTPAAPLGESK